MYDNSLPVLGKHLLFISVDIANSTEMKQNILVPSLTNEWMDVIDGTFEIIKNTIYNINEALNSDGEKVFLNLWKFLGDELVFVAEYSDVSELRNILKLLTKHVKNFSKDVKIKQKTHIPIKSKSGLLNLDRLYFSAWTMFVDYERCRVSPLSQINLPINETEEEKTKPSMLSGCDCDYKSPSMDIGFRLAQHKKIGRIFLSVELAYQLSVGFLDECKNSKECDHIDRINSIYIHEAKGKPMKGVLGGNVYPLYWIDLEEENIIKGKPLNQEVNPQYCARSRSIAEDCLGIINRFSGILYDPFDGSDEVVNRTQLKTKSDFDGYYRREHMKSEEDMMSMKENQTPQGELVGNLPDDII